MHNVSIGCRPQAHLEMLAGQGILFAIAELLHSPANLGKHCNHWKDPEKAEILAN